MTQLTHEEIRKREELKKLIDSELFQQAIYEVRQGLGEEMLRTNDPAERERLFQQSQLINRIQGKLNDYAAELVFLKTGDAA